MMQLLGFKKLAPKKELTLDELLRLPFTLEAHYSEGPTDEDPKALFTTAISYQQDVTLVDGTLTLRKDCMHFQAAKCEFYIDYLDVSKVQGFKVLNPDAIDAADPEYQSHFMFNVLIEVQVTCVNGLSVMGQGKWAKAGGALIHGEERKIS